MASGNPPFHSILVGDAFRNGFELTGNADIILIYITILIWSVVSAIDCSSLSFFLLMHSKICMFPSTGYCAGCLCLPGLEVLIAQNSPTVFPWKGGVWHASDSKKSVSEKYGHPVAGLSHTVIYMFEALNTVKPKPSVEPISPGICGCQWHSFRSCWPICRNSSCAGSSSGAAAFPSGASAASSSGSRSSAKSHTCQSR